MSIPQIFGEEDHKAKAKARARKRHLSGLIESDSKTRSSANSQSAATLSKKSRRRKVVPIPASANGKQSWSDIGVCPELVAACLSSHWKYPTQIQCEAIPNALNGMDIIGLAETGSGKTAAFLIPILQRLLDKPMAYYALILAPTRELALQIHECAEQLGKNIGLKTATVIGGVDRTLQALSLQKKPHIIIATPGRLLDHLLNTKGFKLSRLKFLVLDEADRILQSEFGVAVEEIIKLCDRQRKSEIIRNLKKLGGMDSLDDETLQNQAELKLKEKRRQTLLFSATMTKKVERLEKASLDTSNVIKIAVNSRYKTVDTLKQEYVFVPAKHKVVYLYYLLTQLGAHSDSIGEDDPSSSSLSASVAASEEESLLVNGHSSHADGAGGRKRRSGGGSTNLIVFCNTKKSCHHLSLTLHNLGVLVVPIHGEMNQFERLTAVEKFKQGSKGVLVATDVAARGLDIPLVKVVINYDLPIHSKDYIHRVGRTARAGRSGLAVNLVTQYDVEIFQRIEYLLGLTMPKCEIFADTASVGGSNSNGSNQNSAAELAALSNIERVLQASRQAEVQIKEHRAEIEENIKMMKRNTMKQRSDGHTVSSSAASSSDGVMVPQDISSVTQSRTLSKGRGKRKKKSSLESSWNDRLKKERQRDTKFGRPSSMSSKKGFRGRTGRFRGNDSHKSYKQSFKF